MKLLRLMGVWLMTIIATHLSHAAAKHEKNFHAIMNQSEHQLKQENSLLRNVLPSNYKVTLQPLGQEGPFHHYRGHVYINISCLEPTGRIVLHAHDDVQMTLEDSTLTSVEQLEEVKDRIPLTKIEESLHNQRSQQAVPHHSVEILKLNRGIGKDLCEIILSEKLKKGMMYQLKLKFTGNISNDGSKPFFYEIYEDYITKERRWYMVVDMKKQGARGVFPCFDEKHIKATLEFNIHRPDKMKAVATMPVSSTESVVHRAGWRKDYFNQSLPMSVNDFGVIIFDPKSIMPLTPQQISGDTTLHAYVHTKMVNSSEMFINKIVHMVQKVESYIGIPFPLPELNLLAIPQTSYQGTSWGVIRFSDKIFTEDFCNSVIPKEILNQWIGHLITPGSVADEDFSTGLSVYLIYYSLKDIMTREQVINSKALFDRLLYYDLGFTQVTPKTFSAHKAVLTAMVMRMFNFTLTESTFKKGVHSFIYNRLLKTFSADDFYNALDNEARLDGVLPVSMSTRDIARTWVDKRRFPVVTVTRNYVNSTAKLEQHTFLREWPHEASDKNTYSWWIPLMYLTRANLEPNTFMTLGWMRSKRINIINLPRRDTFIIVNPENIGLFMVNYDETNWRLLSDYLMESVLSLKQPQIPAGTRSKLLYDAIYLAIGGELNFDVALDMTLFIKHERDPEVWDTISDALSEIKGILHDTPLYQKFLIFIRYMFEPAFEYFKGKMDPDMLIEAGYEPLLEKVKLEFRAILANNSAIDMPLRTLCSIFRWSEEDWDLGLKKAIGIQETNQNNDQAILLFTKLAECTINPQNVNRVLSILLINNNTFTTDETEEIMESIMDYSTFIQFISNNWGLIESRFRSKHNIWTNIFEEATKDVKTQEGFELVSELYHIFQSKMGNAKHVVENSLQAIKVNVYGKYKFLPIVDKWLDRQLVSMGVPQVSEDQTFYT